MQYYEKSLGNQNGSQVTGQNADSNDDDDDDIGDDIEAQIKKEVEGLKPKSSKPRLFQKVTSNMPCSKLPPSLVLGMKLFVFLFTRNDVDIC
jgi:tRNA acetyltransferase TAN1